MESRELRYFVAVAEELHVGRAAERLGMAQPPLSRAVAQLERRLGVTLLDRSRPLRLTDAGAVLLREGRAALDALEAAEQRTRRAAPTPAGAPGIAIAVKAGASDELLAKLLDAYAAEPGAVPVEVVLCGPAQQARLLRTGRVDVALLHPPIDDVDGLDAEVLHEEGQVALLPAGHPLSTRATVTTAEVEDLPGLPAPRWPRADGTYPDGPGPEVHDHAQLLQLVALGRTTVVVPDQVRGQLRGGVTAVPVTDAPRVTTVVAWPPHSRSLPVARLVTTALRL